MHTFVGSFECFVSSQRCQGGTHQDQQRKCHKPKRKCAHAFIHTASFPKLHLVLRPPVALTLDLLPFFPMLSNSFPSSSTSIMNCDGTGLATTTTRSHSGRPKVQGSASDEPPHPNRHRLDRARHCRFPMHPVLLLLLHAFPSAQSKAHTKSTSFYCSYTKFENMNHISVKCLVIV